MDKKGAVISTVAAVAALGVLMGVFVKNASPYVTVKEALASNGSDGLHVAGQIEPNSLVTDMRHSQIRFCLKDEDGQKMNVVYTGEPLSNLGSASKVVAIGGMKDGKFLSDHLLVKCPSKYESTKTVANE